MNRNSNARQAEGFTIIELMIAMAFIATLLLAIVATIMQIGTVYNKGVAMKSVNQAGRAVVADIKRTIGESPLLVIPEVTDTIHYGRTDPFLFQNERGGIIAVGGDPYGGRLCTGIYSYIWNSGKHVDDPANEYDGSYSTKQLRLVRVRDNGGQYCTDTTKPVQFSDADGNQIAFELLSENNLAIEDFTIDLVTRDMSSGAALYNISIAIGSADQDEIDTVDNTCRPPDATGSYQNYCAVNQFIFTARAGNKGGE